MPEFHIHVDASALSAELESLLTQELHFWRMDFARELNDEEKECYAPTHHLTIKLSDNSTVSGHVTDATEIECQAPEPQQTQHMDGDGGSTTGGDDHGDDNAGANQPTGENENENEAQNENENENEQTCGTSSLTRGTVVHEAELKVSSAGSVWEKVELVTQA